MRYVQSSALAILLAILLLGCGNSLERKKYFESATNVLKRVEIVHSYHAEMIKSILKQSEEKGGTRQEIADAFDNVDGQTTAVLDSLTNDWRLHKPVKGCENSFRLVDSTITCQKTLLNYITSTMKLATHLGADSPVVSSDLIYVAAKRELADAVLSRAKQALEQEQQSKKPW